MTQSIDQSRGCCKPGRYEKEGHLRNSEEIKLALGGSLLAGITLGVLLGAVRGVSPAAAIAALWLLAGTAVLFRRAKTPRPRSSSARWATSAEFRIALAGAPTIADITRDLVRR